MAKMVLTVLGRAYLLEAKQAYLNTLYCRLYVNNYVPTDASLLADFTECDFDGYSEQILDFVLPVINNGDGSSVMEANQIIWTPTGTTTPNQVYGYYVIDPADSDNVIFAQRLAGAPYDVGDTLLQFVLAPEMRELSGT